MDPYIQKANDRFYSGPRDAEAMPYLVNDAVQVIKGNHLGMAGTVISLDASGGLFRYTVELSSGLDIQAEPSEISLLH